MKRRFILGTMFLLFSVLSPAWALKEPFDHSLWDQFLKQFVNQRGEVDYAGAVKDPSLLDAYLQKIQHVSKLDPIRKWPREEQIALWINLFNASVMKEVLDHYPIKELNDIPQLWDRQFIRAGEGVRCSLNGIRRDILLGHFHDEKIHTALFLAAKSSPRLRREAYTGAAVEGQLLQAARAFVNDPELHKIIPGKKKIYLSRILKWYAYDFKLDFARFDHRRELKDEEYAVLSFMAYYLEDAEQILYLEQGDYKIKYLPFDWSLNEWERQDNSE